MFYVHTQYFTGTGRVGRSVRYISHREEQLPGGVRREIYGIGERYRSLRGDERAVVARLRADADGLRAPRYYRWRFTVDEATARRLARLGPQTTERALRDAVERTFRGTLRHAQGIFVVHHHNAGRRSHGHPHVHALLSPLSRSGRTYWVAGARLARVKERWEREVLGAVARLERRRRPEPTREPQRARGRRPDLVDVLVKPPRAVALQASPAAVRTVVRGMRQVGRENLDTEGRARRVAFRLLTRAVPAELRRALDLARLALRLGGAPR